MNRDRLMIIGSNKDKLDNIMRDMKRHTSEKLREAIKFNPTESRREWMLWIAGPDLFGNGKGGEKKRQQSKLPALATR